MDTCPLMESRTPFPYAILAPTSKLYTKANLGSH
jgi:hypothetical protein